MSEASELARRPCTPRPLALSVSECNDLLARLPGWEIAGGQLCRTFRFPDFYATMAFVDALAQVAHTADHHPDLYVAYGQCRVAYSTHSVAGLSANDFICAARIDLLQEGWGSEH